MKILSTSHRNFQEFWEDVDVYLYMKACGGPPGPPEPDLTASST